jgi:hypothetical protein
MWHVRWAYDQQLSSNGQRFPNVQTADYIYIYIYTQNKEYIALLHKYLPVLEANATCHIHVLRLGELVWWCVWGMWVYVRMNIYIWCCEVYAITFSGVCVCRGRDQSSLQMQLVKQSTWHVWLTGLMEWVMMSDSARLHISAWLHSLLKEWR